MNAQTFTYRSIGIVENDFDDPVAPDRIKAIPSRIVLDEALVEGLDGLEVGQQLLVIFAFHLSHDYSLRQYPRGDTGRPSRGVFALRSPRRPNPIGVTTVELLAIAGNVLTVGGLDAVNGTPVLDLKPA